MMHYIGNSGDLNSLPIYRQTVMLSTFYRS